MSLSQARQSTVGSNTMFSLRIIHPVPYCEALVSPTMSGHGMNKLWHDMREETDSHRKMHHFWIDVCSFLLHSIKTMDVFMPGMVQNRDIGHFPAGMAVKACLTFQMLEQNSLSGMLSSAFIFVAQSHPFRVSIQSSSFQCLSQIILSYPLTTKPRMSFLTSHEPSHYSNFLKDIRSISSDSSHEKISGLVPIMLLVTWFNIVFEMWEVQANIRPYNLIS